MDKQRVIDGGANGTLSRTEGSGGRMKGAIIKMAEAEADGTGLGGASSSKGSSKGMAEGVREDSRAHENDVIEELHKVVVKGLAP